MREDSGGGGGGGGSKKKCLIAFITECVKEKCYWYSIFPSASWNSTRDGFVPSTVGASAQPKCRHIM